MRLDVERNDVLLALVKAVEDQLNISDWHKLELMVKGGHIITEDERLLRSLYFNDDDYGSRVIHVIDDLIKYDPKNVGIIEKYVNLNKYLKANDAELHKKLYGTTTVIINYNNIPAVFGNAEISRQTEKIEAAIEDGDSVLAIATSKDLLENVLKQILEKMDQPNESTDIQLLLKSVQVQLNIDPSSDQTKVHTKLKRMLRCLGQLVVEIAEMRNLAGTGHGKTQSSSIDLNYALLIVNTAYTISIYLTNLLHNTTVEDIFSLNETKSTMLVSKSSPDIRSDLEIPKFENADNEFKSSFMHDYKAAELEKKGDSVGLRQQREAVMKGNYGFGLVWDVAKAIAGFSNSKIEKGRIWVGIKDVGDGSPVILGLENDLQKSNSKNIDDDFGNWVHNLLRRCIRDYNAFSNIVISFHSIDGKQICLLEVTKASKPMFLFTKNDPNTTVFYKRDQSTARTDQLQAAELTTYIKDRFV